MKRISNWWRAKASHRQVAMEILERPLVMVFVISPCPGRMEFTWPSLIWTSGTRPRCLLDGCLTTRLECVLSWDSTRLKHPQALDWFVKCGFNHPRCPSFIDHLQHQLKDSFTHRPWVSVPWLFAPKRRKLFCSWVCSLSFFRSYPKLVLKF